MTWVPKRGQRAKIRSRFADLMTAFQNAPTSITTIRERGTAAESRMANSAPVVSAVLQDPSHPIPDTKLVPTERNGAVGNTLDTQTAEAGKDQLVEWTRHHIPPRHPKKYILKRVRKEQHQAYHTIFGASGSLEECIEILRQHWWPDSSQLDR